MTELTASTRVVPHSLGLIMVGVIATYRMAIAARIPMANYLTEVRRCLECGMSRVQQGSLCLGRAPRATEAPP